MTIELYVFPPSPRAFKVMVLANHLGLDHAIRIVDLPNGGQRDPAYAALNPNMRMPTMKDGDVVLWESNAIQQYLALKSPDSGLLPTDERGRLDVTRWQFWDLAHWDPACAGLLFEYIVKPFMMQGEPDPAAVDSAMESFHRAATVLNGQLATRRFVTGDRLSVADFAIAAPLNYAEPAHYPLETYGEIKRWFGEISALPAWRETAEQTMPKPQPA
jgi:glutathione S-transferase